MRCHHFIEKYPFATLISNNSDIEVTHLPLLLNPKLGPHGTLTGHMAKKNNQWKSFDGSCSVIAIFHGPHAYISPSWYKKQPDVPTWNYAVVHVKGIPRIIDDEDVLLKDLDFMIRNFEPALLEPVSETFIPTTYKKNLLKYIIGFKIEISEFVSKFKLGQNRSEMDQDGLLTGLSNTNSIEASQLADFIKKFKIDNPCL